MQHAIARLALGLAAALALAAPTARAQDHDHDHAHAAPATPAASVAAAGPAADAPLLAVHKSPTCGCCIVWMAHLRDAGLRTEAHDTDALAAFKREAGVPEDMQSCHTAIVEGYFIEGHVPAADIQRLLAERPDARGLAVPGMPLGSPGMEVPSGQVTPYTVFLVARDGSRSVWATYGE